jgi:EAL and modified HD-GYP domain-containing signal transduction protein
MTDPFLNDAFLTRQPIIDAQEVLIGYELQFRSSSDSTHTDDGRSAAAALVCAAYAELGVRSALGNNRAFICVTPDFLHDDAIELLPADGVVIELSLDTTPDDLTLTRCRTLRDRGYSLALAGYRGLDERSTPLLAMLDIIKIDTRHCDEPMLEQLAGSLRRLPVKLLAEGVNTRAQMEACRKIGFQLFQGRFFAEAEIVSGRRLSATQSGLIRLINLAARDADTATIEAAFKHEPALMVNLLRIVNSVGVGGSRFGQKISSLRHAITLLGRRQLQRWLQLLLIAPNGSTADLGRSPLMQVAALRGRMMELLAEQCHPRDRKLADLAFITGIMSMMPAALGLPINEILEQITLEPEVMQALCTHEGALGQTLALIEFFDNEDAAGCDALLENLGGEGIDRAMLNTCLTDALRWVNGNTDD